MYEVKESDWKKFRKRVPGWQESYMEKLTEEYIALLQEDKLASEKFWELEDRIFKDKRSVGVAIDMRRSRMITNILSLLDDEVIQMEELKEFSDELQECINFFINGR